MNKIYLVYESNYGELQNESGATEIIGAYKTREQAEKVRELIIKQEINENTYILDEEIKGNYKNKDVVILFWNYQENWNNYYELGIKEMEVQ